MNKRYIICYRTENGGKDVVERHTVFRRLWRNESARRQVERAQRYAFGEVYVYDGRGKCLAAFSDHNTGEYMHVASLTEEINKAKRENK